MLAKPPPSNNIASHTDITTSTRGPPAVPASHRNHRPDFLSLHAVRLRAALWLLCGAAQRERICECESSPPERGAIFISSFVGDAILRTQRSPQLGPIHCEHFTIESSPIYLARTRSLHPNDGIIYQKTVYVWSVRTTNAIHRILCAARAIVGDIPQPSTTTGTPPTHTQTLLPTYSNVPNAVRWLWAGARRDSSLHLTTCIFDKHGNQIKRTRYADSWAAVGGGWGECARGTLIGGA